jgi:glyoxylase-like metal-dependent hydrolase (beta-lactamase superfamily II)
MKDIYFIEGIGLCSNIYIFIKGGEVSLVDAGSGISPNRIAPQLEQLDLTIESIVKVVLTHGHIDHIGGLAEISKHAKPRVLIHERDSDALRSVGIEKLDFLKDGDVIQLGTRTLTVLHTPGHTSGGICLHDNEMILSGDTVFPGGYLGRADLPSGSWQELVDSLERLARLDVRIMLPGHGEPLFSGASSHLELAKRTAQLLRY